MNEEVKYDLIEKYLAGEMSGEERSNFELKLKKENALREEVKLHQQIAATLGGEQIHNFRKTIQTIDNQWERPSEKLKGGKVFRLNFKKAVAVAASLALLVFAWQFFFSNNGNPSGQNLFHAYHAPYQMVLNQRSNAENPAGTDLLNAAIQQYSTNDFAAAAASFEKLYINSPENIAYQFYRAVSLLSDNKPAAAIPVFANILATPNHLFMEQSRWYLGLAYLKNNEREKAIAIFEKIKEGEYKFAAKEKILSEIK